jgi:hypothetical protein
MDSIPIICWTDQLPSVMIMTEIISLGNTPHHHPKGTPPMGPILLLAGLVALNIAALRWGVDSRDSQDWETPCTSR